jgi:hypothetical protein
MAVSTAAVLTSEPEEVQRAEATKPKRRRRYEGTREKPAPTAAAGPNGQAAEQEGRGIKGKGIRWGVEALNWARRMPPEGRMYAYQIITCLSRIPRNDKLRKRGFQIVTDWLRHNQ